MAVILGLPEWPEDCHQHRNLGSSSPGGCNPLCWCRRPPDGVATTPCGESVGIRGDRTLLDSIPSPRMFRVTGASRVPRPCGDGPCGE
eukprot:7403448-Pyramimonas_sp.AAC.1